MTFQELVERGLMRPYVAVKKLPWGGTLRVAEYTPVIRLWLKQG